MHILDRRQRSTSATPHPVLGYGVYCLLRKDVVDVHGAREFGVGFLMVLFYDHDSRLHVEGVI